MGKTKTAAPAEPAVETPAVEPVVPAATDPTPADAETEGPDAGTEAPAEAASAAAPEAPAAEQPDEQPTDPAEFAVIQVEGAAPVSPVRVGVNGRFVEIAVGIPQTVPVTHLAALDDAGVAYERLQ